MNKSDTLRKWQFGMEQTPLQVKARVLDPPSLCFAQYASSFRFHSSPTVRLTSRDYSMNGNGESLVQPRDGGWRLGRERFTAPGRVDRWVVVVFDSEQGTGPRQPGFPLGQVQQAVTGFAQACAKMGIQFASMQPSIFHAGDTVSHSSIVETVLVRGS